MTPSDVGTQGKLWGFHKARGVGVWRALRGTQNLEKIAFCPTSEMDRREHRGKLGKMMFGGGKLRKGNYTAGGG